MVKKGEKGEKLAILIINLVLALQNGSILDGLLLWKRSVDKKFEGVEDCMVCFSVIHGTNYQLPRLQCRTCKKKFHSACLVSDCVIYICIVFL